MENLRLGQTENSGLKIQLLGLYTVHTLEVGILDCPSFSEWLLLFGSPQES